MKNLLLEGTYASLEDVAEGFQAIMKNLIGPVLIVIGSLAAVYAIVLGVQYAKAEDANKRKEVQGRLIGAAIGVLIIVIGITLVYALPWETIYTSLAPSDKA